MASMKGPWLIMDQLGVLSLWLRAVLLTPLHSLFPQPRSSFFPSITRVQIITCNLYQAHHVVTQRHVFIQPKYREFKSKVKDGIQR